MTRSEKRDPLRIGVVLVFVVLLGGQYDFERLGFSNPLVVPERLLGAIVVLLFICFERRPTARSPSADLIRWVLGFFLYSIISAIWSPVSQSRDEALVDYVTIGIIVAALAIESRRDPEGTVRTFAVCMVYAGTLYSILGVALLDGERMSVFGGGPNVYGRITGMGAIAVLYFLARGSSPWLIALLPITLSATVLSGSRGAMLGLAIGCLSAAPWLGRGLSKRWIRLIVVATPALVITVIVLGSYVATVFYNRFVILTFRERYVSSRDDLVSSAVAQFHLFPVFGGGLQSWEAYHGGGFYRYPHNLIAQFAAELGVVGLLLFLVVLVKYLHSAFKWRRFSYVWGLSAGGVGLMFTASQFSGGHYDARYLWVFLILGACASLSESSEQREISQLTDGELRGAMPRGQQERSDH